METTELNNLNQEKERISLDYTAKGYANWNIILKEDKITDAVIERLKQLDEKMRETFPNNVMSQ